QRRPVRGSADVGPRIDFEKTALGVRYNRVKDLPNGNRFARHAECIVPNAFIIPDIRETGTMSKRKQLGSALSWGLYRLPRVPARSDPATNPAAIGCRAPMAVIGPPQTSALRASPGKG